MSAMRDASVEFGGRSRFWGSLLKTIEVDDDIAADLEQRFAALNTELLGADPKLDSIKTTLRAIRGVNANGAAGDIEVRAIHVKMWQIIEIGRTTIRERVWMYV